MYKKTSKHRRKEIRPVRSKTFVYTKELSFTLNIIDKNKPIDLYNKELEGFPFSSNYF